MAAPMSRASAALLMPATISPAMISRIALVKAMPGTRAMSAPMMMQSGFWPMPAAVRARATKAETAAPAMVLKKRLAPSREVRARHRQITMPQTPPQTPSHTEPP